jgi:predicted nuclease with RNAse H fold
MSNTTSPKYIIGLKNLEPAPPEYMYYMGVNAADYNGKGTHVTILEEALSGTVVLWTEWREEALTIRSMNELAAVASELTRLGWLEGLHVYEVQPSYTLMDSREIINEVNRRKVDKILSVLSQDDIDYLVENDILDLTIVT